MVSLEFHGFSPDVLSVVTKHIFWAAEGIEFRGFLDGIVFSEVASKVYICKKSRRCQSFIRIFYQSDGELMKIKQLLERLGLPAAVCKGFDVECVQLADFFSIPPWEA